jgi:hypothetical protein
VTRQRVPRTLAGARRFASLISAMIKRSAAAIEVYDTPAHYPVPHRKPWAQLAAFLALLLTLATIVFVAFGILVQRA